MDCDFIVESILLALLILSRTLPVLLKVVLFYLKQCSLARLEVGAPTDVDVAFDGQD